MAIAIIQARIDSTRLPGKALMDVGGQPMIRRVVERAREIEGVTDVIVATTDRDFCPIAKAVAGRASIFYVADLDENDVLGRYAAAAKVFNQTPIMRITGDCPLLDPAVCARVLQAHRPGEFTTNASVPWLEPSGYPDGLDADVFDLKTLLMAEQEATEAEDREHVSRWMARHVPVQIVKADRPYPGEKLSVDTLEDLARVRTIIGEL